ncbi:MAG: hypothetical protein NTV01_19415, partial [Bacteroidia bacterium]|nr:hypothetical protein [Bacteroidia bacterium]
MNHISHKDFTNPGLQPGGHSPDDPQHQDLPSPSLPSPSLLSHLDSEGRARMVDVGSKPDQLRMAKAEGRIILQPDTILLIRENLVKKGDVLTVAEIAGIQAAKST